MHDPYTFICTSELPEVCELVNPEGWRALQFYETGLVDPKLWPFGDDLRERFELTRVSCHLNTWHHCRRAAVQGRIPFCCAKLPLPVSFIE